MKISRTIRKSCQKVYPYSLPKLKDVVKIEVMMVNPPFYPALTGSKISSFKIHEDKWESGSPNVVKFHFISIGELL